LSGDLLMRRESLTEKMFVRLFLISIYSSNFVSLYLILLSSFLSFCCFGGSFVFFRSISVLFLLCCVAHARVHVLFLSYIYRYSDYYILLYVPRVNLLLGDVTIGVEGLQNFSQFLAQWPLTRKRCLSCNTCYDTKLQFCGLTQCSFDNVTSKVVLKTDTVFYM
jgi:hypothetical protein